MEKKTKYHNKTLSKKPPMTSYKIIKQNADGTGKQFQIDDKDGNGLFIMLLLSFLVFLLSKLRATKTTTTNLLPTTTTTASSKNINYQYTLTTK